MKSQEERHKIKVSIGKILTSVMDPEVEVNIVDLGLIYKIDYENEERVDIEMTLSTPACPLSDTIVLNIIESIKLEYPDLDVNVNIVFEPRWSPDMVSEAGKKVLKL